MEGEAMAAVIWGVYAVFMILMLVSFWKIFVKANQPGWTSIIPVYSFVKLLEIIGKPWWWLLLMFIPIVNIVFIVKINHLLGKSFGKDIGFTIGLIFLPFIFLPVLAFGDAKYQGPIKLT